MTTFPLNAWCACAYDVEVKNELLCNAESRCTHTPSQETINPSACVRAYPVAEKHRFVWLWPGDAALADEALIPDMHWNDDAAWAGDGKMVRVHCDDRLVLDNLMDLTHETFVHGASIGQAAVAEAPFVTTHGNRSQGVNGYVLNTITPETDKTCLYFWAFARNYALHDQRPTPGSMWMRRLVDNMIAAEDGAQGRSRVIPLRSAA